MPFAKNRLQVDDGMLGTLLLLLGIGSICAMPLTGLLTARLGSKWVIVVSGIGMAATLPFLAVVSSATVLSVNLFVFGAFLGSLDVAMNVHAVEVERASDRPLMSGFHALYSVGGFLGSAMATTLLSGRLGPSGTALCGALLVLTLIGAASPFLLTRSSGEQVAVFVLPHGIVLLLSALTSVLFLVEGAFLDWSALLVIDAGFVSPAQGGIAYILFTSTMTVGRLLGDRAASLFGGRRLLLWGGILACLGMVLLLEGRPSMIAMSGILLVGLGAANIVPVLFRLAGVQTIMPASLAITSLTTIGYAGILSGPALIGFLAKAVGLHSAFWLVAALLALVPVFARTATAGYEGSTR